MASGEEKLENFKELLDCPVCSDDFTSDKKIHQCENGHPLCGSCFVKYKDAQEVAQGHKKPQIVYLTFDDALSNLASTQFYEELFGTPTNHTYSNPNGCALRF